MRSHPTRVRGLKLITLDAEFCREVAPHTGAWIETIISFIIPTSTTVAPHTGAWIETMSKRAAIYSAESHPTRVRGLKLRKYRHLRKTRQSHPTRVRGLKLCVDAQTHIAAVAPHTGAWIETLSSGISDSVTGSHPTRVRGLKLADSPNNACSIRRTPHGCVD